MRISSYWKAIVAGIAAGAASVSTALQDNHITAEEGWTALIAVLFALGFTWAIPNKPAPGEDNEG
jgi:membrane-associated PAP2 superfamily phosphatase